MAGLDATLLDPSGGRQTKGWFLLPLPGAYTMFVWVWLIVNDRKFLVGTVFFSHINQPTVLLHEPTTAFLVFSAIGTSPLSLPVRPPFHR
jgi:hypothetical protein